MCDPFGSLTDDSQHFNQPSLELPSRRWSCESGPPPSHAPIDHPPASYYHNLGLLVQNHLHMSNQSVGEFASGHVDNSTTIEGANYAMKQVDVAQDIGHIHNHPYNSGILNLEMFHGANSVSNRSVSAPVVQNSSSDMNSRRRFRTNFTEQQAMFLEDSFRESHYPDHKSKRNMAAFLNIPEDRITVWFQNRRAKWRRKEMRDKERSARASSSLDYSSFSFDSGCFNGPSSELPSPNLSMYYQEQMSGYPMKLEDTTQSNYIQAITTHSQKN